MRSSIPLADLSSIACEHATRDDRLRLAGHPAHVAVSKYPVHAAGF